MSKTWLATLAATLALTASAAAAPPPRNPFTAPTGAAAMHGDSLASDTTPLPGPGLGALRAAYVPLAAACPSILIGGDAQPLAVCTEIADRAPAAHLLDPATGRSVARLKLAKGDLFSGVYPYLDERDRIVFADGSGDLLRIAHDRTSLKIVQRTHLPDSSGVVGIAPDWKGRVWFATGDGVAGVVRRDGSVRTRKLDGSVANSIATAPGGVAVATDRSLYLLRGRTPRVVWRRAYDRGPHRKPGQLSHGTGSTPTFFGPRTGWEYLAIVDNREPVESLRVLRTSDGRPVCDAPTVAGSENSPIGAGRSVIVASTYGYPYPATPEDAGPAVPETAPFAGGMTRVDVRRGACVKRWTAPVRSAAVPKLSVADRLIYTVERRGSADTGPLDSYDSVALDLRTGAVRARTRLGAGTAYDTLQLAGNIGPGRVLWQGTITGLLRIAPAP